MTFLTGLFSLTDSQEGKNKTTNKTIVTCRTSSLVTKVRQL